MLTCYVAACLAFACAEWSSVTGCWWRGYCSWLGTAWFGLHGPPGPAAAVAVCPRPTGHGACMACCPAGRRLLLLRPGSLCGASASVWRWAPAYMWEEGACWAVEMDDPPSGAPLRPRRRIYVVPRLTLARHRSSPRPRPRTPPQLPSPSPSLLPQPCVDGGAWMRRR
jgi:hypothetical protein